MQKKLNKAYISYYYQSKDSSGANSSDTWPINQKLLKPWAVWQVGEWQLPQKRERQCFSSYSGKDIYYRYAMESIKNYVTLWHCLPYLWQSFLNLSWTQSQDKTYLPGTYVCVPGPQHIVGAQSVLEKKPNKWTLKETRYQAVPGNRNPYTGPEYRGNQRTVGQSPKPGTNEGHCQLEGD